MDGSGSAVSRNSGHVTDFTRDHWCECIRDYIHSRVLLYRKVSPNITAAKTTVDQAQETSSIISDKIVKPMVASSTLAHSAGQVAGFIMGLSKGKGGQNNGK